MFEPEMITRLILALAILAGVTLLVRIWVLVGRDDVKLFGRKR